MEDIQGQKRYNTTVKKVLQRYNMGEKMEHLAATISSPPTKKQIEDLKAIEKVREKGMKKGERKCKKIYVSRVAFHSELKKAKLKICLLDLLIKRNIIDTRIKWKMVEKLADITDSRHTLWMPNQA
eukprot:8283648-Ditylum_brightwellii.AAC.1